LKYISAQTALPIAKCGDSTIASAMLRLQVGDQAAEVMLPVSRLPSAPAYNKPLCDRQASNNYMII
jgi:hypothetical protein